MRLHQTVDLNARLAFVKSRLISFTNPVDGDLATIEFDNKTWPAAPAQTSATGFLIGRRGFAVGYHAESCGCVLRHDFALAHVFNPLTHCYVQVPARPIAVIAQNESHPLHGQTNACIYKLDFEAVGMLSPTGFDCVTKRRNRIGEAVTAYGIVGGFWCESRGKFQRYTGTTIETSTEVYHGYCGGPLLDKDLRVIGMGAKIPGWEHRSEDRDVRAWGGGYFDDIGLIIQACGGAAALGVDVLDPPAPCDRLLEFTKSLPQGRKVEMSPAALNTPDPLTPCARLLEYTKSLRQRVKMKVTQ